MNEVNNLTNLNKKTKSKSILSICIFVFLCLLLAISFFKVPVVGKLIDAIFFDFLFGHVKLAIYIWLVLMLVTWYKKDYFYTLFSKRKILSYVLITFLLCFFSGILNYFINKQQNLTFLQFFKGSKDAFFDNWYKQNIENLLDFKNAFLATNYYAFGGLIGVIYVSLLNEFVMITLFVLYLAFTTFITILCYYDKILYKVRNKIIKLCGGFNSKEIKIKEQNCEVSFEELNEKKKIILREFNINENDVQIREEKIIISVLDWDVLKNISDLSKDLKINNIKIKIKNNEIELS